MVLRLLLMGQSLCSHCAGSAQAKLAYNLVVLMASYGLRYAQKNQGYTLQTKTVMLHQQGACIEKT